MTLHFRGLEVPALGSPRDKIYRQFLLHEAKVEAKKHELALMIAMGTPVISDSAQRRTWDQTAKDTFDTYVMMLLGYEGKPENLQEQRMLQFYERVIKKSSPILRRDKSGKLSVKNLPKL